MENGKRQSPKFTNTPKIPQPKLNIHHPKFSRFLSHVLQPGWPNTQKIKRSILNSSPKQLKRPLRNSRGWSLDLNIQGLDLLTHKQKSQPTSSHLSPITIPKPVSLRLSKKVRRRSVQKQNLDQLYTQTQRVQWKKRVLPTGTPVILIIFEGVIGGIWKLSFWDNQGKMLFLRSKLSQGLKLLNQKFYTVLFSTYNKSQTQHITVQTKKKGVKFDAVYRSLSKEKESQDYSQVVYQFGLQDPKNQLLILTSVSIDQQSLAQREGNSLIRESSLSFHKQNISLKLPNTPQYTTILVSHLRSQALSATFESISSVILQIFSKPQTSHSYASSLSSTHFFKSSVHWQKGILPIVCISGCGLSHAIALKSPLPFNRPLIDLTSLMTHRRVCLQI